MKKSFEDWSDSQDAKKIGRSALGAAGLPRSCDHDCEPERDPRAPFGFEAVRCKRCGTKFHIPKGEAY
jgi:hypothetical protein